MTDTGERTKQLFAWAIDLLTRMGLIKGISDANTLYELDRIRLDLDCEDVELVVRDVLRPPGGEKQADCFVGLGKDALRKILKNRFADLMKDRREKIEEQIKSAAAQSTSASAEPFKGSPADTISFTIRKHIWLPKDWYYTVVTFWSLHTHFYQQFEMTSRLFLSSAAAGCGKTELINILERLVARPHVVGLISGPSLRREIDMRQQPTVLVDDGEKNKIDEDWKSIVDNGWKPGAHRTIVDKGEP